MSKRKTINRPDNALLARALPLEIWEQAERQANRGQIAHFSVGAALFKNGEIISRGCSHMAPHRSVHAEHSALGTLPRKLTEGAEIVVVSVYIPTTGWSFSARPCGRCARQLHSRGVEFVHYAHRDEAGVWSVRTELVSDLARAAAHFVCVDGYASQMKIRNVEAVRIVAAAS